MRKFKVIENGSRIGQTGMLIGADGFGNLKLSFGDHGAEWFFPDQVEEVSEYGVKPKYKLEDLVAQCNLSASEEKDVDPLDIQHGGDHYKTKGIQPIEYITANNLGFCEGNIIKYVTRHEDKNGAEDIKKIIHYAQFILKFKYGETE